MITRFDVAIQNEAKQVLVAEGLVAWCPNCKRLLNKREVMPMCGIWIGDKEYINRAFHHPGCEAGTTEIEFKDPGEFNLVFEDKVQDEDEDKVQDEGDDTEGEPCVKHAYCCTISPRCEDCPEPCKDEVCPHWKTCIEYTPGTPEPRKCFDCEKILGPEDMVMGWIVGENGKVKKSMAFCDDCMGKRIAGTVDK